MMVKFTNAANEYKGNPLYINSEWIVSCFEESNNGGSLYTVIFGGPTGIPWYVEESLSEVVKITNGAK
jgi:hypothetical protein